MIFNFDIHLFGEDFITINDILCFSKYITETLNLEFEISNSNIILNEGSSDNLNYFNSKVSYYILVILPAKFLY
jgi:hypothetical protein